MHERSNTLAESAKLRTFLKIFFSFVLNRLDALSENNLRNLQKVWYNALEGGKMAKRGKEITLKDEKKTVRITRKQEALLAVLRKPEHRGLTQEAICKLAEIDRSTFHRAMSDETFIKVLKQECQAVISAGLLPLSHRLVDEALNNQDKNAHHWAKLVAEMGDIYQPGGRKGIQTPEINLVFNFPRPGQEPAEEAVEVKAEEVQPSQ